MSATEPLHLIREVRALGAAAPFRAAYEISKRSGLHATLFKIGRNTAHPSSGRLEITACDPGADAARERCLDDARQVMHDGARVFGHRVKTGILAPWSMDPLTGQNWPEHAPWWKIDIRSEGRMSDVKYVWEAGRHRDVVVLARASVLEPDGPWMGQLVNALSSWCRQCPPEKGVHWYSSLELALRAIAWSQVLTLARDRLPATLVHEMDRQLLASGRHLTVELPYTVSSMRNNHMLGDALGFLTLAKLFPQLPRSRRWDAVGNRLFNWQLRRHMRPDGSMIEDSVSYHRFVLEMLVVRLLIGDAPPAVAQALAGASDHLRTLGVFDGEVPQYGDWDEGRVLTTSGDVSDLAGSAALGLALTGSSVPASWYGRFDELAWYGPRPVGPAAMGVRTAAASDVVPSELAARQSPYSVAGGGVAHVGRGPWKVWFKVGGGPSHGHADLTSVWVKYNEQWVISDPGTGTYNGDLQVRNGLRVSAAHPVLRPGGSDQLVPHRAFRWLRKANGHISPPVTIGMRTVIFGWHDAYAGDGTGPRIGRVVLVGDGYVAVMELADQDLDRAKLTLPLHPTVAFNRGELSWNGTSLTLFGLDGATPVTGRKGDFAGWHSSTYGQLEPSTWLLNPAVRTPCSWGLSEGPMPSVDHDEIDGLQLSVAWQAAGATLTAIETHSQDRFDIRALA